MFLGTVNSNRLNKLKPSLFDNPQKGEKNIIYFTRMMLDFIQRKGEWNSV